MLTTVSATCLNRFISCSNSYNITEVMMHTEDWLSINRGYNGYVIKASSLTLSYRPSEVKLKYQQLVI